jgi:hypothetical protein
MSSTESVTYVSKAIIEQTVLGLGEIFDDNGVDRKILDDLSLVCVPCTRHVWFWLCSWLPYLVLMSSQEPANRVFACCALLFRQ